MLVLIDKGKDCIPEGEGCLMEEYRIAKGDSRDLTGEAEELCISLRKTQYGFTAVTSRTEEMKRLIPDVVFERPDMEEILMACMGKGSEEYGKSTVYERCQTR